MNANTALGLANPAIFYEDGADDFELFTTVKSVNSICAANVATSSLTIGSSYASAASLAGNSPPDITDTLRTITTTLAMG